MIQQNNIYQINHLQGFFDVNARNSYENSNCKNQMFSTPDSHLRTIQSMLFYRQMTIIQMLSTKLMQNNSSIQLLSNKIDDLNVKFENLMDQMKNDENSFDKNQFSQRERTKQVDSSFIEPQRKQTRTHYKTIFRQKIFGIRQYKYKLHIQNRIPLVFYKQRNIQIKIKLLDQNNKEISNQNALSLNLKVFYSNGQEVGQTKKGQNFIKGTVTSTMIHGKASFDKLYPRQVSRKLQKKKLVIVIYPSSMGNSLQPNSNVINPIEIEPIILYGVTVITKQQRKWSNQKQNQLNSQCQSQFVG